MHIPTHILSGWCVANCFNLTPRERFLCMAAASLQDLDGLGVILGVDSDAYQLYHHVLCHNLPFVSLVAIALAIVSKHKLKMLGIALFLGHLHLLMDLFGSGPGWGIAYRWPFSREVIKTDGAWEFFSWQNITAAGVLLAWTLYIARRHGHTPVECITPDLDRRFVARIRGAENESQEVA